MTYRAAAQIALAIGLINAGSWYRDHCAVEGQFREVLKRLDTGELDFIDSDICPRLGDTQLAELAACSSANRLRSLVLDRSRISDDGVAQLPLLSQLRYFSAARTRLSDRGVARLCEFERLENLRLDRTKITDAGLHSIGRLHNLKVLSLWRCAITDDGLAQLKHLGKLESLSLDETRVSAAGVNCHLRRLMSLRRLSVWRTRICPADLDELRSQLPNLEINFGE